MQRVDGKLSLSQLATHVQIDLARLQGIGQVSTFSVPVKVEDGIFCICILLRLF